MSAKIQRLIKRDPAQFDYADFPPAQPTAQQIADNASARPLWLKDRDAARAAGR